MTPCGFSPHSFDWQLSYTLARPTDRHTQTRRQHTNTDRQTSLIEDNLPKNIFIHVIPVDV